MQRSIFLSEICTALQLQYSGENVKINGLNLCNRESKHTKILSYVTSDKYLDVVQKNPNVIGLVLSAEYMDIYKERCKKDNFGFITCDDPEKVFYDIHEYLYYQTDFYDKYDFPAQIGNNCVIHPSAVIESGVRIGEGVVIGANSVIRKGTIIGNKCVIGCNTTVGSEGFQIIKQNGKNRHIVHCGGVIINDNVCVGDNATICNSLFENTTYIGKRVMIDNLVHIGHNVVIESDAVITAGVVLCGSAVIKRGAWVGVNSSVLNQVTVGAESKIGIGSVVTRHVSEDTLVYGVPAKTKSNCGGVNHKAFTVAHVLRIIFIVSRESNVIKACRSPDGSKWILYNEQTSILKRSWGI